MTSVIKRNSYGMVFTTKVCVTRGDGSTVDYTPNSTDLLYINFIKPSGIQVRKRASSDGVNISWVNNSADFLDEVGSWQYSGVIDNGNSYLQGIPNDVFIVRA